MTTETTCDFCAQGPSKDPEQNILIKGYDNVHICAASEEGAMNIVLEQKIRIQKEKHTDINDSEASPGGADSEGTTEEV